jgi:hypothetical protein
MVGELGGGQCSVWHMTPTLVRAKQANSILPCAECGRLLD